MAAAPLWAQTPPPAGDPPDGSPFVVVEGLAKEDLLNIRAAASPLGRTLGRLPNGTVLRNFGCGEFDSYKWCEVEGVGEAAGLKGWTPARYLFAALPPEGMAEPTRPAGSAAVEDFSADGPAADDRSSAAAALPSAPAAQTPQVAAAAPAQPAPAPDLTARMGGEAEPPLSLEALQRSAAATPEEPAVEAPQAPASAASGAPEPAQTPLEESRPAAGEPADVRPAVAEEPIAVAEAMPAVPAEAAPVGQVMPANAPPPALQAAEQAPAPPASPVFYDGFLQHGVILWVAAAVAALVFGLL